MVRIHDSTSAAQMKSLHTPIRVAALGLEQSTYRTLQLFFQDQYKNNYVLVGEQSADISIIDLDGYHAEAVLKGHRKQYPNRPAILISVSDNDTAGAVFVRKPLQIATLTKALNKAQTSITHMKATNNSQEFYVKEVLGGKPLPFVRSSDRYRGNKRPKKVVLHKTPPKTTTEPALESLPNVNDSGIMYVTKPDMVFNPHNPLFMSKIQYQPQDLLQSYLQHAYNEALKHQSNVQLEGPWRPITIYYRSSEMSVRKNFRHLYALSLVRIDRKEVTITVLDEQDTPSDLKAQGKELEGELVIPVEQFLWKLALKTSRGRVPVGTDFYAPVKLIRWPNFARSAITPHSFRIAALWSKSPTSLLDTANILDIPLQYVFVFYSAAITTDLVEQHSTNGRNEIPSQNVPEHARTHAQKSIFKVLLNRLRSI